MLIHRRRMLSKAMPSRGNATDFELGSKPCRHDGLHIVFSSRWHGLSDTCDRETCCHQHTATSGHFSRAAPSTVSKRGWCSSVITCEYKTSSRDAAIHHSAARSLTQPPGHHPLHQRDVRLREHHGFHALRSAGCNKHLRHIKAGHERERESE